MRELKISTWNCVNIHYLLPFNMCSGFLNNLILREKCLKNETLSFEVFKIKKSDSSFIAILILRQPCHISHLVVA